MTIKILSKNTMFKKDLLFAICLVNQKHIGCGLHQINYKKQAQFGIIIGNIRYHGKGIGKAI